MRHTLAFLSEWRNPVPETSSVRGKLENAPTKNRPRGGMQTRLALYAPVAELEYAQRLGRCPERVAGPNPARSTIKGRGSARGRGLNPLGGTKKPRKYARFFVFFKQRTLCYSLTSICIFFSLSTLGTFRVKTPSVKVASALAGSPSVGKIISLAKGPQKHSCEK